MILSFFRYLFIIYLFIWIINKIILYSSRLKSKADSKTIRNNKNNIVDGEFEDIE